VSGSLDIVRHTVYPGSTDPNNPDRKFGFHWMVCDSSMSETYPAGQSNGDKHRTIRWGEAGTPLYAGRVTRHLHSFRIMKGSPGRMFNHHNQPADPGFGWGSGYRAVSPYAIDWYQGQSYPGGASGLVVVCQPTGDQLQLVKHFQLLSDAEMVALRGQWVDLAVEVTWGRRGEPVAGAVKAWAQGNPKVNVANIHTHWDLGQSMLTMWEGSYWSSGAPAEVQVDIVPTRLGRTWAEAIADRPTVYSQWGSVSTTGGGPATGEKVGTRALSEFRMPTGLV